MSEIAENAQPPATETKLDSNVIKFKKKYVSTSVSAAEKLISLFVLGEEVGLENFGSYRKELFGILKLRIAADLLRKNPFLRGTEDLTDEGSIQRTEAAQLARKEIEENNGELRKSLRKRLEDSVAAGTNNGVCEKVDDVVRVINGLSNVLTAKLANEDPAHCLESHKGTIRDLDIIALSDQLPSSTKDGLWRTIGEYSETERRYQERKRKAIQPK